LGEAFAKRYWTLRQRIPMLDLSLFRDPTFSGANTVMFLVGLAMFGIFFYNSLFLQRVLGYGAIKTGATFLSLTVLIILVAPTAGKISDRIGPRLPMTERSARTRRGSTLDSVRSSRRFTLPGSMSRGRASSTDSSPVRWGSTIATSCSTGSSWRRARQPQLCSSWGSSIWRAALASARKKPTGARSRSSRPAGC
jgi:hypothetical protein